MQITKDRKTALLIGATGLVGRQLLPQLLEHPAYGKVKVFVRRPLELEHERLEERLTDFGDLASQREHFRGDDLFSALGTTIAKAGSKEAFYKIDHDYNLEAARLAKENGAAQMLLVSSVGADPDSLFFYTRVKGELEEAIKDLGFWAYHIFRPSVLLGDREELRPAEALAARLTLGFDRLTGGSVLKGYRPVEGATVAAAMIQAAQRIQPGVHYYPSHHIHQLAEEKFHG